MEALNRFEPETPDVLAYDVLQGLNAGNFLARRSLEDMQASTDQYWGHTVMLTAATDGATPSEGPVNKMFKIGNREISIREQYIAEQASQLRGRFEAKLGQLRERHWNLMSQAADKVKREMERHKGLLECAVVMRNFPDRPPPPTAISPISGNPVPDERTE